MPTKVRLIGAAVLALLLAAAPAAQATEVLVVGDSLEELTSPYLPKFLPGVKLTVNAVGGSNSYQIFDLFQESYDPSQSVIVFDAGTNDNPAYPQILAENLSKVAAIVGDRCMVVPTIHGYVVNGVDNAGKNRVVREFAASRPGTQVPDWAGFRATHPELMADELHPGPAGAEARAELIAQGVMGCLTGATASGPDRASSRPALAQKPTPLPTVHRLRRRRTELLREIAAEIAGRAALLAILGGRR